MHMVKGTFSIIYTCKTLLTTKKSDTVNDGNSYFIKSDLPYSIAGLCVDNCFGGVVHQWVYTATAGI